MLSEFNFNCFEKPTPVSTNVPLDFMLSAFLVTHVEIKLASTTRVGGNRSMKSGVAH